jgi:hypothetical protein
MKISQAVSRSVASIIAIIVLTLSLDLFVTQSARAGTPTTVINNLDNGSGSLRFVVATSADNAVITFDPSVTGTILLTSGQIEISNNVTIQGPGAKTLAVDGGSTYRIFHVNPGLTNVNISGLTLTHGVVSSTVATGGAVYNEGVLNFKNCRLTANYVRGLDGVGGSAFGGAIYSTNTTGVGTLGLTGCTVDANSAIGGSGSPGGAGVGAGIYIPSGYLGLTNCTFAFNNAYGGDGTGSGDGGNGAGGAIYSQDLGDLINCTIRLNGAVPGGSALGSPGYAFAGGVLTPFDPPYTRVLNTILTDNSGGASPDGYGVFNSLGHNLHGKVDGEWIDFGDFTTVIADNGASLVTPGIGPLADNGGDTPTFAISQSSLMHDHGDDHVIATPYGLTSDQRGGFRLADLNVDIGAYEYDRLFWFRNRVPWLVGSGRWDFSSNWEGIPCLTCDMLITNGGTKTITIDSLMSSNFLTVNNLLVSAPSNSVNTLLLSNAGLSNALTIVQNLFISSGGALSANGSAIQVGGDNCCFDPGCKTCQVYSVVFDAPASFNSSALDASRAFEVSVGTMSAGTLGLTGSVFYAHNFVVGGGGSAAGTANFVNSTSTLSHALSIASTPGSVGTLSILGGQFTATNSQSSNDFPLILDRGNAQLNVSDNATAQFGNAIIGNFGQGTVRCGPGTMALGSTYLGMSKGSSNQFGSGVLDVLGGQITMPDLHIGVQGTGEVWMASGTLSNNTVTLAEQPGSYGSLLISGGTHDISSSLTVAGGSNSIGIVTVSAGSLNASNAPIFVGPGGSGQLVISNGTVMAQQVKLGGTSAAASGLARIFGGLLKIFGLGGCEACGFTTNDGEVDGGDLDASTTSIVVGLNHNAAFTVTGGTVEAGSIFDGYSSGFTGTYTQSAGTVTVSTNFIVGNCASNAIGHATLSNGNLYITNAVHNAALIVGDGDFTMASGTLVVDKLIVTNSCGHFFHNGGSLTYGQLILDPNLDADGDGLSNGYELAHGLDPFVFTTSLVVVNNSDSNPGSLRQAILDANGFGSALITFAPNVIGTIALSSGELDIGTGMNIVGPGANVLRVDGNGASRVFAINNGKVTISGLTITNGAVGLDIDGGGIYNGGDLVLNNCALSGNRTGGGGGAIFNDALGSLSLFGCALDANRSFSRGGGAILNQGTLQLDNCTLYGNYSDGNGGGLNNSGVMLVNHCTVYGNSVDAEVLFDSKGGGIYGANVTAANQVIESTIIAHNDAPSSGYDAWGVFSSGGFNLVLLTNGSAGWVATGTGVDLIGLEPRLGSFQNNGGPTYTMPLLPRSPAIDQGLGPAAIIDQQQTNGPFITGNVDVWQSFTAGISGRLMQVGLGHWSTPGASNTSGTISIYTGEGTSGTLLATTSVTFSNAIGLQLFPIPSAPQVAAGNQYTFRCMIPGAPNFAWVLVDTSDPYAGGRALSGATYDYVFRTYVVPATTDQRGVTRPYDIPYIANPAGGDGSDIGAFELIPPTLSITRSGPNVVLSWPSPSPGFFLYQNTNVADPNGWTSFGGTINDNGVLKSATVNPVTGNIFFRLGP